MYLPRLGPSSSVGMGETKAAAMIPQTRMNAMTENQELLDRDETEGGEAYRTEKDEEMSAPLNMPNPQPLVIYHHPCLDGFTAAWAMWLKYPDAEFVPGVYGQKPPDVAGRDVYLLDFSYSRAVMDRLVETAKKVTVLDHHKTAQCSLEPLLNRGEIFGEFHMEKSGARLAWEWFHPGTEVPLFVRLVEDRDLWRFAVPNSRALNAAFFSYDYDFERWSWLRKCCEDSDLYRLYREAGEAIERKHHKDIAELVPKLRHARYFHKIDDGDGAVPVPCVNLPYTLASDAGNMLAQDAPFAAVYYQDANGDFVFSLRSFGVDVSEVAKKYGGGGHKHAAGFRVKSLEAL